MPGLTSGRVGASNPSAIKPADARAVWRSFRRSGIGLGTLYHLAQDHGWTGELPTVEVTQATEAARVEAARERAERDAEADGRAEAAAALAAKMMAEATYETHPYLERKGFPDSKGMVSADGRLLIPMRHSSTKALLSMQTIAADGEKKFLFGGRASNAVYLIGRERPYWYVEGLATGLSVQMALKALYRNDAVCVTFSASNLSKVAKFGFCSGRPRLVALRPARM